MIIKTAGFQDRGRFMLKGKPPSFVLNIPMVSCRFDMFSKHLRPKRNS